MNWKQVASLLFSLVFISFALMQYNDPNPWGWIVIYLIAGSIVGLAAFGKVYSRAVYVFAIICLIWMIFLFPGLMKWITEEEARALLYGMSPDKMHIEESREFLGLLMIVGAMALVLWRDKRNRISRSVSSNSEIS